MAAIALGAVATATAQEAAPAEEIVTVSETVTPMFDNNKRVITNSFWNNWFIQAGAGAQIGFTEHDREASFGDRLSPSLEVAIGKWFTPGIGVRVAYNGLSVRGATQSWLNNQGVHSTGEPIDGKFSWAYGYLEHQRFNYMDFHIDVMFNLCQMIGGYNPQRLYSCIPYIGIGIAHVTGTPKNTELAFNCGVQNTFRVSKRWDINLSVNAMICDERFSGESGNRHFDALLGATVGATYRFGRCGWDNPVIIERTAYDNGAINRLRGEKEALEAENNRLRKELDNATAAERLTELIASGNVIFFNIGTADITAKSRANLSFLADAIKNTTGVYSVTGYADKGTGSAGRNMELSKMRAEAARDCLVNEFGVPADRLAIDYKGGVDDIFYNDPRCSRCVIVIPQE